jgi:hypothetical protein
MSSFGTLAAFIFDLMNPSGIFILRIFSYLLMSLLYDFFAAAPAGPGGFDDAAALAAARFS